MLKILIIGDEDLSLPFRATGCEARYVENSREGRKVLLDSTNGEYGIIFIAESIAVECMDIISKITESKPLPIITILPDVLKEEKAAAEERIREIVKRAMGIELPE
ncbi:hypothetical protein IBX65_01630 [Candidatus Aerophobetes bacterium]|nr:hypothetical protein [Candidatus Aerophobetes bacterium]